MNVHSTNLNMIIKSYLMPKYNIDIFLTNDSQNLKKAEYINSANYNILFISVLCAHMNESIRK